MLVGHSEHRAILGAQLAPVVHAHGRDVRVPQQLLHVGEVCVVLKSVGGGRSAQRVRSEPFDVDADDAGIPDHYLVDVGRRDRARAAGVVADGPEQRSRLVVTVAGRPLKRKCHHFRSKTATQGTHSFRSEPEYDLRFRDLPNVFMTPIWRLPPSRRGRRWATVRSALLLTFCRRDAT